MWFIVTHSVLSLSSQQNLDEGMSIPALKQKLFSMSGTDPQDMHLQLYNTKDELLCEMHDADNKTLGQYGVQEYYRIHVVDNGNGTSGTAAYGDLEDTSQVEKFSISEEDYSKREDSFRKWKERNIKVTETDKPARDREQEELQLIKDKGVAVGQRCEVLRVENDMRPRGEVAFVGKVDFAGGYWIGVKLDEPLGKNDGSVKGKSYFTCAAKYGSFVRPDKINVGEQYKEVDLFDDDDLEDEI